MTWSIRLPTADGSLAPYALRAPHAFDLPAQRPSWNRVAFAAAHVVADPRADVDPWLDVAIDWEAAGKPCQSSACFACEAAGALEDR